MRHARAEKRQSRRYEPVRLGIIGCGRVAVGTHLPALASVEQIRVEAVADADVAAAEHAARRFRIPRRHRTPEELVADPALDAVAVCVPPAAHAEYAVAALERGKHLFVEKPLALTLEEADAIADAAGASSTKTTVGFNLRSHRAVREARRLIGEGEVGSVRAVSSLFNDPRLEQGDLPVWRTRGGLGGGALMDKAIHHFDLWRFLLQDEVVDVFARASSGQREDELVAVSARTRGDAHLTALSSDRTGFANELSVWGDAGSVTLDLYRVDGLERADLERLPGAPATRVRSGIASLLQLLRNVPEIRSGGAFTATYAAQWRAFADAIKFDEEPRASVADGVAALEIALAAGLSAATRESVEVETLRRRELEEPAAESRS